MWGWLAPLEETELAGVEELIINDQYIVVLGITLLFTVLAIFRRTPVLDAMAMIFWWATAGAHLVASPSTSPLFTISLLWMTLGFVFLILLFKDVWKMYDYRKSKGVDWMDEEL